jgi:hypothetical protein
MTASKSTNIALSQIAILEQALDEVPARNATEVGKAKAIGILAPKIHALRAKGYAWREVAAWLTEHGVAVTVPALQRHLRGEKLWKVTEPRPAQRADALAVHPPSPMNRPLPNHGRPRNNKNRSVLHPQRNPPIPLHELPLDRRMDPLFHAQTRKTSDAVSFD